MKNAILALVASSALVSVASADSWYSSVYGGWNQDDVISGVKGVDGQSGYVIGGSVGKRIAPNFRLEADLAFRQNEIDIFKFASADHNVTSLMANVIWDVPVAWQVKPYLLGGAGYAHSEIVLEDISLLKLESSGFAWQLGAGASYPINDTVSVSAGYRYMQAEPISVLGTELSDGSNHSVLAQVTFSLN